MIKKIHKQAVFVLIPLSLLSALIEPRKVPASILVGGVLALLNFSGLARGLETLLGTHRPTIKLLFLSMFRLFVLSAVILLLAVSRLVNLPALAAGFTVVVVLLVIEGFREARKESGQIKEQDSM